MFEAAFSFRGKIMGQAAIRITPEMINFLKKRREAMDETLPDGRPAIDAPIIRAADAPIQPINRNLSSPPTITAANNAQMPPADQIQPSPVINRNLFNALSMDVPASP